MMLLPLLHLAVAAPAGGTAPPAWFDVGHRLIARIAAARLTPPAAAAVRDLLAGQDMAEVSSWADLVRGQRRETLPLHFVNIPLEATRYDSATQCRPRCIISAIAEERRSLADPAAPLIERTEALKFLIHFMGDLHQPLHVSDNDDRGGNQMQVQLAGRGTNLHKVWDGELMETTGLTEDEHLARLEQAMAAQDLAAFERGTVVDWAMEGHEIAVERAYPTRRRHVIDDDYLAANLPVVDLCLIKAGVRLAWVLNQALGGYRPAPPVPALPPGQVSDREAAAHAGETVMVVGTVVSVHRTQSGNLYLNFGADYPHQTFSGAVLEPRDDRLRKLDGLAGRRVGIRGTIRLYQGQPEILIQALDQIVPLP